MPPELPDPDAVLTAIRAAVGDAFGQFDELPTNWVLIAETVGIDGERGLWTAGSEGAKPWVTLGLLDFAVERERAQIIRGED